jgi:adenosylmethionine-8-amino-7-oxononanoate aminotransferase
MDDSSILHKALKPPPQMVSGSGSWLRLDTGREIIDACSGVGVSCLGYQDKSVASAVKAQLEKFAYSYSSAYSTDPCEKLAKEILEGHPGGLSKATFFCSGAEATEAALKTTVQYWKEKGRPQRTKFISRKHSYHGSTLGALSVSGHTERREPFAEWLSPNVSFVDPCYPFRGKPQDMSEEDYVFKLKDQLEAEFVRLGPENVAAFIVETIPGSTLGCVPASPGYFRAVREVCDKYGALLILDEVCIEYVFEDVYVPMELTCQVMCGMGRTGTYHAWQQEEEFRGPDLQTVSKSLGGGFIPLSAVLIHERIVNAIRQGTGSLNHSQTFQVAFSQSQAGPPFRASRLTCVVTSSCMRGRA